MISCSGCHQKMGLRMDARPGRSRLYCSELCIADHDVIEMSERQDNWEFLKTKGIAPTRIARVWGSPHALVYRTLERAQRPVASTFPWLLTEEPE